MKQFINDLFDDFYKRYNSNEFTSEKKLISDLVLDLQINRGLKVVSEKPYSDGRRDDQFSDMYIQNENFKMWIEFKPILQNFKYVAYSKFFPEGANKTHVYNSNSPILNDIDKVENVPEDDYFLFLLLIEKDDETKSSDKPVEGKKLSSKLIVDLVKKRCEATDKRFQYFVRSEKGSDLHAFLC